MTSLRTVQEPPRWSGGEHQDARNLLAEVLSNGHMVIRSRQTSARLEIHRQTQGKWLIRYSLVWPKIGGSTNGERQFNDAQLLSAFNLHPDGDESMYEIPGLCRRLGDHLTIPGWVGEVVDGTPCMSIRLSRQILDTVSQFTKKS